MCPSLQPPRGQFAPWTILERQYGNYVGIPHSAREAKSDGRSKAAGLASEFCQLLKDKEQQQEKFAISITESISPASGSHSIYLLCMGDKRVIPQVRRAPYRWQVRRKINRSLDCANGVAPLSATKRHKVLK